MRRLRYILGATALLLVAAVVAGIVALQTQSGQTWLAATLSRTLSSSESRITISGLSGTVPTAMHVDRIELADPDGAWLQIDDATLELGLRDLLHRQLTVRRLAAERIDVKRAPSSRASEKPSSSDPFVLPRLPVDVVIENVAVDRVHLEEPLLGESVAMRVAGHGRLTGDGVAAQLAVDRTDSAGNARLDFRLGRDRVLALHLDAAEPSGTLLQHALHAPDTLPVNVTMHGEGPLEAWQAKIDATAGAQERLQATIKLEGKNTLQLTSEGSLSLQQLLPQPLRQAIANPIGFAVRAKLSDPVIVLERLSIESDLATIAAQGEFDQRGRRFSGTADVNAPDLRPIGTTIDTPLGGALTARIKAGGTFDAPQVEVALQGTQLDATVRADRIVLALQGARRGSLWSVHGDGEAAGLAWPIDRAGLPEALTLAFDARMDESVTQLTLDNLNVETNGTRIAASGAADHLDTSPSGRAKISIVADDLARWRDAAGLPLGGRLSIDSDVAVDAGAISAKITGKSDDLTTHEPHLDALLGGRFDLRAAARRAADGTLTVETLDLAGKNLAVAGDARSNADFSSLDARLDVDLPRLAVLSDALGTPMQGAAKVQARLTGALTAPQAQIDAQASDVRFGAQRLDRLTAKAALSDALAPRGTLTAALKSGTLDATADADFARTNADTIEISRLALRAPGSEMNGAVRVNTARPGANGSMTLRVSDLSRWSPLAGMALAGAADARVNLAEKDGQRADIDATVSKLRLAGAGIAAERIKIEARLSDLLGKPAGRASVDAAGVALPDLRLDSVRASAQSARPEQFNVSLDAQGVLRPAADARPLRLASAGEIALSASGQRIRVTRLTGRVGAHDIVSRAPLTVALGANSIKVDGLDLGIGAGRVTGSGSREPAKLAVQAQLRNLPLALVQIAMPDRQITGTADATIRLVSTGARPDGQFEMNLREVRMAAARDLPPLSATAAGTWKGEALDVTGQVTAPGGTKADLRGTVPLRLDAATMMPVLVQNGALSASVKSDGRIERWAALLPLGEDSIGGRYSIDLAVAGTPAKPEPKGRLAISDGRYANFAAGTEISNLAIEINGDRSRFVLSKLAGGDGAKGTLEGKGTLDLDGPAPSFDVTARFTNFGFLRRDEITASGDSELRFAGTTEAAKISGRVHVDRAEIRIPDRLPPSIPNLPVIEVDSRTGKVLSKPEETTGSSSSRAIALALDVDIPARAFVRGRGLDSEWRGALQIGGSTSAPQILGKLETVRGDFSLLAKHFTLTDSTITFMGGEKIDPQLNITAQYQAPALLAQAIISGTVSNPSIKLTSQPEMPQDEVLARVLFGRSVSDMTPGQGLELAQAAASLASGGPGILDRFRSAIGLDRLDISSQETSGANGADSTTNTTVTAGKYIADGVFVGVEQGRDPDSTRSKVEVEITPNISVESSVGNSAAGAGVNWKWDY